MLLIHGNFYRTIVFKQPRAQMQRAFYTFVIIFIAKTQRARARSKKSIKLRGNVASAAIYSYIFIYLLT